MSDLISRQAVLKLLSTMPPEEAITQAMLIQSVKQMSAADCISRRAALDAFTDALNDVGALDAEDINTVLQMLPSAQPDEEKISDALYYIYRNTSPHTSAEGVAATKYYIREIYREIFGEEGPGWMKK